MISTIDRRRLSARHAPAPALWLTVLLLCGCADRAVKPDAAPAGAIEPLTVDEQRHAEHQLREQAQDAAQAHEQAEKRRNDPCATPEIDEVAVVDDTRQFIEETLCSTALWVDGVFGDPGDATAARRTHGFIELSNFYSEFEGFDTKARLRVEVDLPNVKNRLSAFVGRENDDDFVRGRSEGYELRTQFPTLDDQNEWLAGLGYALPGSERLQTRFRVGVRGLTHTRFFVQGRLRYNIYADRDDVIYVQTTPFWNNQDGFGITQSFDASRVLSPSYLLRWYSVGTMSEKTEGLNWRNSLVFYQNLQRKRGLAYELYIRGETDEPEPIYEYGPRVLFRHPFLKERFFAEWGVGYGFFKVDPDAEREGSVNLGLGLEMPFGTEER